MKITLCDTTLGAAITDVILAKELDDATLASIETAWYERGVLIFPQQRLSNEVNITFFQRFGVLERGIKEETNGHPVNIMLSNLGADASLWLVPRRKQRLAYADSSFKRVPAMASTLGPRLRRQHGIRRHVRAYQSLDATDPGFAGRQNRGS